MVYKFLILSDEVDLFLREIKIDADNTFFDLHEAILNSVKYDKSQMTSFVLCNDEWEKEQEITLVEMDAGSEYDNLVMSETVLSDYVSEEGQKLLYIFDYVSDRAFFIRLEEIITGKKLEKAVCVKSEDNPPQQIMIEDLSTILKTENFNTEFYGDEDFNLDEIDDESFSDLNFEEDNFEEPKF
jgi:hypothetical protein